MEKEKDGVWRTIRGRRIFIGKGESLGEAMSKSGKFKREDIRESKHELKLDSKQNKLDRADNKRYYKTKQSPEEKQRQYLNARQKHYAEAHRFSEAREDKNQAEKNRINENEPQRVGNTREQKNYFRYSEADRRELSHEKIQKKLADFKAKKQSNNKIDDKQNDYTFTKTGGNNYFTTERVDKDGDMVGKIETHDRDVKKPYYVAWKPKDENLKYSPNGKWETQSFDTKEKALDYLKEKQSNNKVDPYDDPESNESQRLQSIQSRYDEYLQDTEGRGASYGEIAYVDSLRGKDLDDFEKELDDYETKKYENSNDNKSIKELNEEMLGDKYKGKGETPSLVYSHDRRIDIANNENGGKTAIIWKDGKIERKTNLPDNVKGDKTKQYFDDYLGKLDNDNNETFIQHTDMYGGTREYSKEDLDRMAEQGIRPMAHSYTGGGWEGVNSNLHLDTKDQAKRITDAVKKKYPDVKVARKTNLFSGGSSIDFNIMSSDKDLFVSDNDIDKMSYEDLHDVSRSNGFEWWAKDNIPNYDNAGFTIDDVRKYAKESLNQSKQSDIQSVRGNEWYLSDYGKKVVSDLNKEANSYTYNDSDGMVDYFDHGTYMHISIGKWNKPYQVNESKKIKDYVSKKKSNHK